MNCLETQLKISLCLDGEAQSSEETEVKEHLVQCRQCRLVYDDLKSIKETALHLDGFEPPDSVWAAIRLQLNHEGLLRNKATSFWERILPSSFYSSLKPALAGAILALIIVGGVYFVRHSGDQRTSLSTEATVLRQVQKAELNYQKAIEALDEVSQRRLESLRPELAQIFKDNLATMDYYLRECRDAADKNPDNPLVHRYLLVAYEKKADLMQTILNSDSSY